MSAQLHAGVVDEGHPLKTLLTIAGFDPSSGAGITADLAVFAAHGCFGVSCATALTVQSTLGVRAVHPVEAAVLAESLFCLAEDLPPDAIKIGMLATAENVRVVAAFLRERNARRVPVVLDPVLRSSSGRELLSREGTAALLEELLPLVDWVTPNLAELGVLLGQVVELEKAEAAARMLQDRFPGLHVVATGGDQARVDDLVLDAAGAATWLRAEKLASRATHGTGCAFSSALACGLADGRTALEAARAAKTYVAEAIRWARPIGHGTGPMALLWPLRARRPEG